MTDPKLESLLRELKTTLAQHEPIDDATRALLVDVHVELDRALAAEEGSQAHPSLEARLRASVQHFEERHPALVEATQRVLEQLANLGV